MSDQAEKIRTTNLSFGRALDGLINGNFVRIARSGWNGKGMFVFLNEGSHNFELSTGKPQLINNVPSNLFRNGDRGTTTRMPNLNMKAADGSTVTGWLASQTDMLAQDWSAETPE